MTGDGGGSPVRFRFEAVVIDWRGPSPFFFAPIPSRHVEELRNVAKAVTYGWGMIPVEATISKVAFKTSLFPKEGGYLLPIKAAVRRKADITAGDTISIEMTIQAVRR
jgi:hypothetical protein